MEGVLTATPDPRLTSRLLPCGRDGAPLLLCIHGGGCHGGYFNLKGFSVAQAALGRGFDVLLLNRPGHGGSAPPRTDTPIHEAAGLLPDHLATILATRSCQDLVVLGHSIGGAVALILTAQACLPVRAVAVSGIGRVPSDAALAWLAMHCDAAPEPPTEFFFGPEASYDWRGPIALRRVVAPWRRDELDEVRTDWPRRFDAVAGSITVPIAFHLAEHERIWRAGKADLVDAARRFTAAARVDAAVLPDGGHLYEIHRRGAELAKRQLDLLAGAVGTQG